MTLSFIARPREAEDWPFYTAPSSFRWAADDPADIAQFLGLDRSSVKTSELRPTVHSRLRGQRISLDLGYEWWPLLTALRVALDTSATGDLTLHTRASMSSGLRVSVRRRHKHINVSIVGDLSSRYRSLARSGARTSESQVLWEMLGWQFGGGPALTHREYSWDTPNTSIAYGILEVLALVELRDDSSDLLIQNQVDPRLLSALPKERIDSETHLSNRLAIDSDDLKIGNLSSAWLRAVRLHGADLRGVDLTGVDFEHSLLVDVDMSGAVLHGASFRNGDLLRVTFDDTNAETVDFAGAAISESTFDRASYGQAIFFNTKALGVHAQEMSVERLLASHATFDNCGFIDCWFPAAAITSGHITQTRFSQTELMESRFDGTVLDDVQFSDCALTRASFQPVDSNLVDEAMRAHPTGFTDERAARDARAGVIAAISSGTLNNVDFDHSALESSCFVGTHLTHCAFFGATVHGADFRAATFDRGEVDAASWEAIHPFWGASASNEVTRRILEVFSEEGMRLPHLPEDTGRGLSEIDHMNFGTAGWTIPGATEAYLFDSLVKQLALGDWTPRAFFGLAGRGMHSCAWTYLTVVGDVAVVAQIGRRIVLRDAERQAAEWSALMEAIERFLTDVEAPEPGEERLVVVFDALRSQYGWIVVPSEGDIDADLAVVKRTPHEVSAEKFFDEAVDWSDGPFREAAD